MSSIIKGKGALVGLTIDETHYPVIVFRLTKPWPKDGVDEFCNALVSAAQRALDANEHILAITVPAVMFTSAERKRYAERDAAMPKALRERFLTGFVIINNPILRGAVTAMRWLRPEAVETTRLAGSQREAFALAAEELKRNGKPVPPSLLRASV